MPMASLDSQGSGGCDSYPILQTKIVTAQRAQNLHMVSQNADDRGRDSDQRAHPSRPTYEHKPASGMCGKLSKGRSPEHQIHVWNSQKNHQRNVGHGLAKPRQSTEPIPAADGPQLQNMGMHTRARCELCLILQCACCR